MLAKICKDHDNRKMERGRRRSREALGISWNFLDALEFVKMFLELLDVLNVLEFLEFLGILEFEMFV